jgi:hypothetical protein
MKEIKAFFIISRYNEDVSWIRDYTKNNYLIYNKGVKLPDKYKQIVSPNFGANQYDMFRFIYDNYDNLPDVMAFVQGDPFDHCLRDRFDNLIYNSTFTLLFGDRNYPDGNLNGIPYHEANTNWYINESWNNHKPVSKFNTFDDYMNHIFDDYVRMETLFFPPGSQIIVEKERCLFYSRDFWKKLMEVICNVEGMNGGREAHIVERSIQIIFENKFKEKIVC